MVVPLFQNYVVHTKLDIYVFITITGSMALFNFDLVQD